MISLLYFNQQNSCEMTRRTNRAHLCFCLHQEPRSVEVALERAASPTSTLKVRAAVAAATSNMDQMSITKRLFLDRQHSAPVVLSATLSTESTGPCVTLPSGAASTHRLQVNAPSRVLCALGSSCPMRILIVEDTAVSMRLFQRYLQTLGFADSCVSIARDGVEAVELAQAHDFDIILMDIHMPRMDGYTACRHIRKLQGERRQRKCHRMSHHVSADSMPGLKYGNSSRVLASGCAASSHLPRSADTSPIVHRRVAPSQARERHDRSISAHESSDATSAASTNTEGAHVSQAQSSFAPAGFVTSTSPHLHPPSNDTLSLFKHAPRSTAQKPIIIGKKHALNSCDARFGFN